MILIDDFEIDAAINEDHYFESEVTEHPVEEGADIADHVRARPITVSIEGIVSDTPIGTLADRRRGASVASGGSLVSVQPSDDAFVKLQAIRDAREPITIETSLRVYTNMVLTSLSAPRDAETGDAFRFRATFTQIQLVTNERTVVRVTVPRAAKKRNLGNKPATPVTAQGIPATVPQVDPFKPATRRIPISTDDGVTFTPEGKISLTRDRDLARDFRSQF